MVSYQLFFNTFVVTTGWDVRSTARLPLTTYDGVNWSISMLAKLSSKVNRMGRILPPGNASNASGVISVVMAKSASS